LRGDAIEAETPRPILLHRTRLRAARLRGMVRR
jgi:hypothetical protein